MIILDIENANCGGLIQIQLLERWIAQVNDQEMARSKKTRKIDKNWVPPDGHGRPEAFSIKGLVAAFSWKGLGWLALWLLLGFWFGCFDFLFSTLCSSCSLHIAPYCRGHCWFVDWPIDRPLPRILDAMLMISSITIVLNRKKLLTIETEPLHHGVRCWRWWCIIVLSYYICKSLNGYSDLRSCCLLDNNHYWIIRLLVYCCSTVFSCSESPSICHLQRVFITFWLYSSRIITSHLVFITRHHLVFITTFITTLRR